MNTTALQAQDIAPRLKPSSYPEPFRSQMKGRVKRALGDHFGLHNFGVNLTELPPGTVSALLHTHTRQDEFVYILQGHPTLETHTCEGLKRQALQSGDCIGFAAGNGVAHRLINESSQLVRYLEVGDRTEGDEGFYPNDDLIAKHVHNSWQFFHKDGSAY